MPEGTSHDTQPASTALTEAAAAERIESLLSPVEDPAASDSRPSTDGTRSTTDHDLAPEPREDESESDESHEAERDDESQEADDESSDEEREDSEQALPKYRVKVDGEELEVTLDELQRGYSRTQDYTRKTQQTAEQRKQLDAKAAELHAEHEKVAAQLTTLTEALQAMTPGEPDWERLRAEDPDHFADTYAAWGLHQERLKKLQAAQREAMEKVLADRAEQHSKLLQTERNKLIEALPAWKDPAVAKRESGELREYAKNLGFSDDDLGAVTDSRVMLMLRKAMLYDRAEAAKPQLREKIERVRAGTPGSRGNARKPVSDVTRAKQRLGQTHRVEDAASVIERMLPD